MSDVPNEGGPTRVLPPYDCHFMGRKPEDVRREIKEIVYEILKNRELSRSEEKVFREVANEAFDIMISAHNSACAQKRAEEKAAEKQTGRDWMGIIINAIMMLIAIGSLIYAIHSGSGGGTP